MPPSDYQRRLDQQFEQDQNAARKQQHLQEREAAKQRREQEKAAAEAEKAAFIAAKTEKEHAIRAAGLPTYTTADGQIHADPTAAAKKDSEQKNKQAKLQAIQSGRGHQINPVDGSVIYTESEAQLEAKRAAAAEALRKKAIDDQIDAAEADHGVLAANAKPLSEGKRNAIEKKVLPKLKQDAVFALQSRLQGIAKGTTKQGWWDVVNNEATPEAKAAQERLARLQQPDADLTDDDIAELEADDATKPIAAKIRAHQDQLRQDDEVRNAFQSHAIRKADLILRRDNPAQWEANQRQKLATLNLPGLQTHLEGSNAALEARAAQLEQAALPLQESQALHQQKLDQLTQEAAQRRAQGIPAGEVVSYEQPDGTVEHWPKDLAAKREEITAQAQQSELDAAPAREALAIQAAEYERDLKLHNEGVALAQAKAKEEKQAQKSAFANRLRFTPGMEEAAGEVEALQSEAETRKAVLDDMYPDGAPPEAINALNADVQNKVEQVIAAKEGRFQAALSAYGDIQAQLKANPDLHATAGDLFIAARQKLAQDAGISEQDAARLLADAETLDWDQVTAAEMNSGSVAEPWKSGKNMTQAEDSRKTRLLSNGAVVVHPGITDEKGYTAAVAASGATPDAQAEAIARYPQIRKAQAQQTLETIQEVQSVLGPDSLTDWENYADWKKKKPADVDEAEWALRWTEANKAKNTGILGTLLSKTKQFVGNIAAGGNDLRQQASGILAGITGSETLMQDAQWAGRKAEAQGSRLSLGGHTSDNFLTRGVFDQLPRLSTSLVPAVGGAKAAQTGLRLFAGTKLGARFLPSLAAAMETAATPAQAVKAVSTLTRAGLGGAAAAGAGQTYGAQIADIYGTLRKENPELDHVTALRQAQMPAVVSGLATALLTVGFGSTGISRLITRPAEAKAAASKIFTSQLQRMGFAAEAFVSGGIMETIEESLDEGISQVAAALGKGHPVQQAVGDFLRTLPEMAVATMIMGGAGEGVSAFQESTANNGKPSQTTANLPETIATAEAAIDNLQLPGMDDATREQAQRRAALALSLAQGGELFDVEESDLNAAGWTRDGDTFKPLKDYAGPAVLDIDKGGRPVIKDSYVQSLRDNGLAAVADAIPGTETQTRNRYAQQGTTNEQPGTSPAPAGPQQPQPSPAPATPAGIGGNANPSPVQAPTVNEPQPPPSGSSPAQSGTPVNPSQTTANNSQPPQTSPDPTAVPTLEKSLADWLVDRYMPDQEAAAAAKALAAHPQVAGKSFDDFNKLAGPQRDTLFAELGITGSKAKTKSKDDPLRFSGSTTANNSQPSQTAKPTTSPPSASDFTKAQAAYDDSIEGTPERAAAEARLAYLREKQLVADLAPVKAAVQAKEMNEEQATQKAAAALKASGQPVTHTALRSALELGLGWNTSRANAAAHNHLGTKDQSDTPLASGDRADTANRPQTAGGKDPSAARMGPDLSIKSKSPLRKNSAYSRAKLLALARIKDPAKKAWARQAFAALEDSLQRHHALYDAIAVGPAAIRRLNGAMTAVTEIDGRITRMIDLDAIIANFDYLANPADAIRATGIEEDIHATVLRLARTQPEKYGPEAIRKQWRKLPQALREKVWQAYDYGRSTLPAKLTAQQEYPLQNEFLRMLVQDQAFAQAITETVDTPTTLVQWVRDLLRDLSKTLRDLMGQVDAPLRAELQGMVDQIAAQLRIYEGKSRGTEDRLATLDYLRDPAGIALQAMQSGVLFDHLAKTDPSLTPEAMARAFDLLTPELQSIAYRAYRRTQNKAPGTKNKEPKSDLLRHLLTAMAGDASVSQEVQKSLLAANTRPGQNSPMASTAGAIIYDLEARASEKSAARAQGIAERKTDSPDNVLYHFQSGQRQFPVSMPEVLKRHMLTWPVLSKSPYGDSFYDITNKGWSDDPHGYLRVADHWNWESQGETHARTDRPVESQHWTLARYNKESGNYEVLASYPKNDLAEMADYNRNRAEAYTNKPLTKAIREKLARLKKGPVTTSARRWNLDLPAQLAVHSQDKTDPENWKNVYALSELGRMIVQPDGSIGDTTAAARHFAAVLSQEKTAESFAELDGWNQGKARKEAMLGATERLQPPTRETTPSAPSVNPSSSRAAGGTSPLAASPRSTNLLSRFVSRLTSHVSPQPAPDLLALLKQQPKEARQTLASLHARLIRAGADLAGARFVQSMPGPIQDIFTAAPPDRHADMIAALRQAELRAEAEGKPMFQGAIPSTVLAELRRIAYAAGEANADLAQSPNATPQAAAELRQRLIQAERDAKAEREAAEGSADTPVRSEDRAADMAAALDDRDRLAEQNRSPQARAALKRRLRAQQYAAELLRQRSTQELNTLEQQRRISPQVRRLIDSMLKVARGDHEPLNRKMLGNYRLAGVTVETDLASLGIRIHPQTARLYTTDPVNTSAYVERGHVILRQEALDDLDVLAPITRQLIRMTERQVRQRFGLPVTGPEPVTESSAAEEEQPESPPAETPPSPTVTAPQEPQPPSTAPDLPGSQPSTTVNAAQQPKPPSTPKARIPLGGKLSLPAQFASQDDLDAFQYQLDRESLLRETTSTTDRRKATDRIQSVRARLIDETGASKEDIEQRLADYHRAVIEAAKKADPVEVFRPTPFHAFASGMSDTSDATLPAPTGGDIISGMKAQGIRRLGPPDKSDGWAWYRELKADAARSKMKPREAARLAKAGDLTDAKALLAWVDTHIVKQDGGRSIDEAAAELSESDSQQFPVASGEELGRAILDAIAARQAARDAAPDPMVQAEKQAVQQGGDFRAVAEGAPGQPFTGRTLATRVQTGDEIQIGSEWLTVTDVDTEEGTVSLDSDRYGPQQIDPDQTLHLRAIGDEVLRVSPSPSLPISQSSPSARLAASRAELEAAVAEDTSLAASPRQLEKLRTDVLRSNLLEYRMRGPRAWLTPGAEWINVQEHREVFPPKPHILHSYDAMHQAGFVRVAHSMLLHAEFHNGRLTPAQRRELENTALERQTELSLDPQPLSASNRTRDAASSYVEDALDANNLRSLTDLLRFASTDLSPETFRKLRRIHLRNAYNTVMNERGLPEATHAEEAEANRAYDPKIERRYGEMPPDLAAKQASITPESIGIPALKLAKQAKPATPTDLLGNPIAEHTEEDEDAADPKDKVQNRGSTELQRLQAIDELYGPLAPGIDVMETQNQDGDTVPHIMRGRGIMVAIDGQPHVAIRSVALPSVGTGHSPGVRFLPLAGDKSNWTGYINKAIQIADPQLDENTDVYIEPYGGGLVYLQNLEPLLKTNKPVLIASSQEFEPDRNLIYTTLKRGDAAALADIQSILNDINHEPQTDAGEALVRVFYTKSKTRIIRKLSPDAAAQLPSLVALLQRPNVKILPWNDVQTFENATAMARTGKRVTLLEDSNYADLYAEGTQDQYKGIDTHPDMFNAGKITDFIGKDPKKLLAQKLPVYRAVLDAGGTIIATNNMNPDLINGLLAEFGDAGHWFGYAHRTRPVPDGFMRHPDGKGVLWSTERPEYLAILRKGVVNPPAGAPKYGTDTSAGLDYRTGPRRLLEEINRAAQPHRAPSPHTGGSLEAAQSIGGPADTGGPGPSAGPLPGSDGKKSDTFAPAYDKLVTAALPDPVERAKLAAELDADRRAGNDPLDDSPEIDLADLEAQMQEDADRYAGENTDNDVNDVNNVLPASDRRLADKYRQPDGSYHFPALLRGIGTKPNDAGVAGKGPYYTLKEHVAKMYAGKDGRVITAAVTLRKPLIATYGTLVKLQKRLYGRMLTGFEPDLSQQFDAWMRQRGYDGAILFEEEEPQQPAEVVQLAPSPSLPISQSPRLDASTRLPLERALAPTTPGASAAFFRPRPQAPGPKPSGQGLSALIDSPAAAFTLLQRAFTTAQRGQSSQWLPIRAVWDQFHAQNPAITPAAFMRSVKAGDDDGTIYLSPPESAATVAAAGPFKLRNASGIVVTDMLVPQSPQGDGGTLSASSRTLPVAPQLDLRYTPADGQDSSATRARSNPLQENNLGGGLGTSGGDERRFPSEASQLLAWAQAQGWLIETADLDQRLGLMQEIPSGDEHDVWHDELTDRAVKVTRLLMGKPVFIAGGATAYIVNLKQQNALFGTGVTFEGIVMDEGQPRIVTSMPWVRGAAVTQQAKEKYFKALGFEPAGDDTFYSMGRDLLVTDARAANVVERPDGTVQPIDIQIRDVSPRQSEMWENRVNARAAGLAASNRSTPKSSTQLTLSPQDAQPILAFGQSIPEADLYASVDPEWSDGALEDEPHVTVLYGLTKHEAGPVAKAIAEHGPVTVTLGKLSLFEPEDYDVLKLDVESPTLRALNAKLSKLPNENTFPDYKPHMTIAYLKKGAGKKYVGDTRFEGRQFTFNTLTFSPPKEVRQQLGRPELPLAQSPSLPVSSSPSLPASPRVETAARALDRTVTGLGKVANLIPPAFGAIALSPFALAGKVAQATGTAAPLAKMGTQLGELDAAAAAKAGNAIAQGFLRVAGKDIRKAPDAVAAWLNQPAGLGAWAKNVVVDQLLPTAMMPREWLALSHEMQRKAAWGAEKSNDLIRALSGNPRLSDLAYPKEFAENMMYREQLFDAMENKIPMSSLPPAMQALGDKLRQMLRDTGTELVRQGIMHPDTFEELQANGWMPRYMLDEAMESGGSVLAAFKLGVKDLMQQRTTAFHIVDTSRKGKDGQHPTVNRLEGGRNAWRFRDAATRDAFYSDFIRRQALDMLQESHGNDKAMQSMFAPLDHTQRREVRRQIGMLTRADLDTPQKLSPALAGMVKAAIEHQKATYKKENPFDPPKLIKDPVYAIARYVLAQTHNAATMELLNETAKNKDWVSDVSLQGYTEIPDNDRFGPLAGKFVQKDIAAQILDKMDVPNAALRFYDAILRKWKSGKLVWNPGSHIRDAVGNTVFAYLGGSNIMNPGNWPYYRQALEIMRNGGPLYAELIENGVLGGDAYSSLVRERLKGLLPDAATVENFNPGLIQRFFFDFGAKFHATHEQFAEYRRVPDDFYKIAAYLKAKAEFSQQPQTTVNNGQPPQTPAQQAAQHVRKWFPYYDRLGGSATTRAAGRFVNPFFSFFRESTRILGTAVKERPIALAAALAFPAAVSALSAMPMLLDLDDRDREEIEKDMTGRGKGILGLGGLHLFSMLLPVRSGSGQVQQFDISAIMPFADLLGQKIVPLEEKENAWQTFWRQTAAAGPVGNLAVSWITNRDTFSGRHLTEADMGTRELLGSYTQHAAGVLLPPLLPDAAAAVGIGEGGALTRAGTRQVNKTLATYDPVQTIIRSVFGMNVKSAAPNLYRKADDFRAELGFDIQPGFDYGTTVTSRAKRLLVAQLAQDEPNPTAIKNLVRKLKELGVPMDTEGDINKTLSIIDPAALIGGSKKAGISAETARQRFRQSLPPEMRSYYEAAISEYQRIKQRAPLLVRQAVHSP